MGKAFTLDKKSKCDSTRPALPEELKYRRPPSFNFDPSGDAGSRKYLNRKAKAKRIKQKNPRKRIMNHSYIATFG